jgi:hypothetical protein
MKIMTKLTFTLALLMPAAIAFSQNVGIGTTTPVRNLHIHRGGTGVYTGMMFSNEASGQTANNGFHVGMQFQADAPGNRYALVLMKDSIPLRIGTSNDFSHMVLSSFGNLGIGFTNPTERLEVDGNIRLRGTGATNKRIIIRNGANNADVASFGQLNDNVVSIAHHTGGLQYSKFYFDVANEKMGVGASPGTNDGKILVNYNSSTGNPHLTLRESALGDYGRLEFANLGATRTWHIAGQVVAGEGTTNRANDILNIWNSSGGDILSIRGDRRVSINTTLPATGYALSVDGKIICEELKVQLSGSWPDYVFNDTYNLLPLPQLAKYISENKHLPGIPNAAQVEKEGISIGDMQKRLMEKIEELSLYMLQQQKQLDAQQQIINELTKSGAAK